MTDNPPADEHKPSWLRWPPNCCETCTGWQRKGPWHGVCDKPDSINAGEPTDARFRCPDFVRKGEKK